MTVEPWAGHPANVIPKPQTPPSPPTPAPIPLPSSTYSGSSSLGKHDPVPVPNSSTYNPTPINTSLYGAYVEDCAGQAKEYLKNEQVIANAIKKLNEDCPSSTDSIFNAPDSQAQSIPLEVIIPDILSQLKTHLAQHNCENSPTIKLSVNEATDGQLGLDDNSLICYFKVDKPKSIDWSNIQLTHSSSGLYLIFQYGNAKAPLSKTSHLCIKVTGPASTLEDSVSNVLKILKKIDVKGIQRRSSNRNYIEIRESSNWLAEVINNHNISIASAAFITFKNPNWINANFKQAVINDVKILGLGNISIELEGAILTNLTVEKGITIRTLSSNKLKINGDKSSWECRFAKNSTLEGATIELNRGRFWCDGLEITNMKNFVIISDNFKRVFSQVKSLLNPLRWPMAIFRFFYDVGFFNYDFKTQNNRGFKFDMNVAERDLGQSTLDLLQNSSGPLVGHALQQQANLYTPTSTQLNSFSKQTNAALNQLTKAEVEAMCKYITEINSKTDSIFRTSSDEVVVLHRTKPDTANVAIYRKQDNSWVLGSKTANLTLNQAHFVLLNTLLLRHNKEA